MNLKEMETSALLERRTAIASEIDNPEADLTALEEEIRTINAELEERRAEEEKRRALRESIANGEGKTIKDTGEERKMDNKEVRNSKEYIDAFAEYVKTGNSQECRALLTELVSGGTVPVPEFVEQYVQTAWEKNEIIKLISKSEIKGVLRVPFELSATDAAWHTEGTAAVTAETLTLGVVTLTPANIKKYLPVSDEVLDLTSEEFLRYIYDEITYRITKALEEKVIEKIAALPETATSTSVCAKQVDAAPGIGVIAQAIGQLSDEASNPVVVMNKATWAAFKSAQYSANYAQDIFEGLRVVFNNSLPAYSAASAGDVYAIVGDFGRGFRANFPRGNGVSFVYDDKSQADADIVRIIGRQYVGLEAIACDTFANIKKPSES